MARIRRTGKPCKRSPRGIDERPVVRRSGGPNRSAPSRPSPTDIRERRETRAAVDGARRSHRRAPACPRPRRRAGYRSRSGAPISRPIPVSACLAPPTQDTGAICAVARRSAGRVARRATGCRSCDCSGVGAARSVQHRGRRICFRRQPPKDSRLDAAVDGIRDRFGSGRADPGELPAAAARRRVRADG